MIADIDKRRIRKVVRKTCVGRRKITLLKDVKIRKQLEEKVTNLVDIGEPNLWGLFKDRVLEACDEVCGKKMWRRSKGDTWWRNEEVKEVVSRKKEAHKAMCRNSTEENKMMHTRIKKQRKQFEKQ